MNGVPNLARDPFLNRRPVRRAALVIWLLAAALTIFNAWRFWEHFSGQGQQRQELAELEPLIAEQRELLAEARNTLDQFDLDWQRRQIVFINARIAERTFAWSALFDHLSEVLPRNVRIERVVPRLALRSGAPASGGRATRSAADEVSLELAGTAEEADALLVLVDAFYAHERFRRPNLKVESRGGQSAEVKYSMNVVYRPAGPSTRGRAGKGSAGNRQDVEEAEQAPEVES